MIINTIAATANAMAIGIICEAVANFPKAVTITEIAPDNPPAPVNASISFIIVPLIPSTSGDIFDDANAPMHTWQHQSCSFPRVPTLL